MAALIRSVLAIFLLMAATLSAQGADRAIIVLDASGSMWGQIDGKPKLQIARDALKIALQKVSPGTELGLMAYGHREKGSCEDIELIVPPGAGNASAITSAADSMKFLGKTPLSAAVRKAAEDLKYTEDKATVILITDGLETCNADPCAVGKELEEAGVDFTAHVVGFGLTAEEGSQVACLAENTGGKYIQASDALALEEALQQTVVTEQAPEPPAATDAEISFVAVDQDGARITNPVVFSVTPKAGGDAVSAEGAGIATARLAPGEYRVAASGIDIAGGTGFTVASPPAGMTVEVPVEVSRIEATLDAPDAAPIASTIEIAWTGPGKRYDEIQVFNPRGPNAGEVLQRQSIANDKLFAQKKVSLVMPARPGAYELRYNDSEAGKILATRAIEVTPVDVSLTAPDSVAVGATFAVNWIGPAARYDDVEIFDATARGGQGEVLRRQSIVDDRDFAERKVTLIAPATAGDYKLRYWNGDNSAVLSERNLKVAEVRISLDAPASVPLSSTFKVKWEGPAARYDDVQIFDEAAKGGEGEVVRAARIVQDEDFAQNTVSLIAPARPGNYQLRYWNGEDNKVLTSRQIEVTEVEVSLDAPAEVPISSTFEVKWAGPAARYDEVQIFDEAAKAGEGELLRSARIVQDEGFDRKTVSMTAPAKPGAYQLRYWNGEDERVLATRALLVAQLEISLDGPASVDAGSTFKVKWTGPAAQYDEVQVYRGGPNGAEGEVLRAARIVQDEGFAEKTVTLIAPAEAGSFELRYWNGEDSKVLSTSPLAVKAIEIAIDAPASVDMGSTFLAGWKGPGGRYDDIQIGPSGSDSTLFSARIPQDEKFAEKKVTLIAPVKPGTYDLRYWNGEDSKVLQTRPIEVKEIPVALIAPEKVKAGEKFAVEWQGPGARYDDVQLVRNGSDSAVAYSSIPQDSGFGQKKVTVEAPAEKGGYELRYWNGEFGAVLAKRPIEVE